MNITSIGRRWGSSCIVLPVMVSTAVILGTLGSFSLCHARSDGFSGSSTRWVGTWSTAPQLVETGNNPPAPGLSNNTLRQIVRVSIGGDSLRLRLSNEFSTSPVTFHAVHIAGSKGGGTIDSTTEEVLAFGGKTEITIAPGAAITSDPLQFALLARADIAITIYFGSTPTDITGHPGSRTTSYLLTGNQVSRVDVAGAVTTDHWYNINAIDVLAPSPAACVAILGNSITDGRGSTTNGQNRWPDVMSASLLKDSSTQHVGVLNGGIGGNCVLAGGLGPTGVSRFDRDILNQQGIRWAVVFEGVNDIGGVNSARAATAMAANLIAAYEQMIARAHAKNIRIYGVTIMPFNGNGYYNQYSEQCRGTVNQWIRSRGNFDACIDFDKVMRNPQDTTRLLLPAFQNDGLHPDTAGHKIMGESIDPGLFAGADTIFQQGAGGESFWFEAERFPTIGSKFAIVPDAAASNGKYVTVQSGMQSLSVAPADSTGLITIPFMVTKDTTYHVFGRLNCPTFDDDSFWTRADDSAFVSVNGLKTTGWEWVRLNSYVLTRGRHVFTLGYREDGACLDKVCISNSVTAPTGMGEADPILVGVNSPEARDWYSLGQNFPNPFNPSTAIQLTIVRRTLTTLNVYDVLGREVATLMDEVKDPGNYTITWSARGMASGVYFYKMRSGDFVQTRKLCLVR